MYTFADKGWTLDEITGKIAEVKKAYQSTDDDEFRCTLQAILIRLVNTKVELELLNSRDDLIGDTE